MKQSEIRSIQAERELNILRPNLVDCLRSIWAFERVNGSIRGSFGTESEFGLTDEDIKYIFKG